MAISWKIEEITDCNGNACNWVSVNPSQGEGDSSPNVTVTAATSPDDCATAYITISASTGQKQELSVIRCLPKCSCKSIKFEKTPITKPLPAAAATHLQIGTYDSSSACLDGASISVGGIFTNPSSGEGKIYADVTENTTTSPRTGFFRFTYNGPCVEEEITQEGKADPCAAAACPSAKVTQASFEPKGGTGSYSIEGNLDCYRSSVSSPNNWITINETNKTFNVASTKASRTGQINFVFTNISTSVKCPTTTIAIEQSGIAPTECVYTVSSNVDGASVEWSDGSTGYIENGKNKITKPAGSGSFSVHLEKEGYEFEGNDKSVSCGGQAIINGHEIGCSCADSNLSITGNSSISSEGGQEVVIANFSSKCVPSISFDNGPGESFIDVSTIQVIGNTFVATVPSTTNNRTQSIIAKVDGTNCQTFSVTQKKAECSCENIKITSVEPEEIVFESGDSGITASIHVNLDSSSTCKPTVEVDSSSVEWLKAETSEKSYGIEIVATTKTRNDTGNDRDGYINLKDGSGNNCIQILLTQPRYSEECKFPGDSIHVFLTADKFVYHNHQQYRYYITDKEITDRCAESIRDFSEGFVPPLEGNPMPLIHYEYKGCDFKQVYAGESYIKVPPLESECDIDSYDLVPGDAYHLYVYNSLTQTFYPQSTFRMPTGNECQESADDDKKVYI